MIFIQSKHAAAAAALEYQNNSASEVLIDKFSATNNDTVTRTLYVYIVPSGGSPDTSNLRLTVDITSTKSYLCGEIVGERLAANDSIWVYASAAATISIRASGRLIVS